MGLSIRSVSRSTRFLLVTAPVHGVCASEHLTLGKSSAVSEALGKTSGFDLHGWHAQAMLTPIDIVIAACSFVSEKRLLEDIKGSSKTFEAICAVRNSRSEYTTSFSKFRFWGQCTKLHERIMHA